MLWKNVMKTIQKDIPGFLEDGGILKHALAGAFTDEKKDSPCSTRVRIYAHAHTRTHTFLRTGWAAVLGDDDESGEDEVSDSFGYYLERKFHILANIPPAHPND